MTRLIVFTALLFSGCSLSGAPAGDDEGGGGDSASGTGSSTSSGTGGTNPTPPTIAVLGNGQHTAESVQIVETATRTDGLNLPNDLEFNPNNPAELWVVNSADDSVTVFVNPGEGQETLNFWGEESVHFLANPSGIAFSDNGFFATIHRGST